MWSFRDISGIPIPAHHGAAQVDNTQVSDIWEYGGDFTKTIGRHTFRAGANFASNNANALYLNSNVQFAAANTSNPADFGWRQCPGVIPSGHPDERRTPQCY